MVADALARVGISTTCILLVWRNDINVDICLRLARKGLKSFDLSLPWTTVVSTCST